MSSKEYKISLIMKCANLASLELRNVRKQGGKHSTHRMTKSCIEIIQNQLWLMRSLSTVIEHVFGPGDGSQFEMSSRSVR